VQEAVSHAVHGNVKSSGAESSSKVLAPPTSPASAFDDAMVTDPSNAIYPAGATDARSVPSATNTAVLYATHAPLQLSFVQP